MVRGALLSGMAVMSHLAGTNTLVSIVMRSFRDAGEPPPLEISHYRDGTIQILAARGISRRTDSRLITVLTRELQANVFSGIRPEVTIRSSKPLLAPGAQVRQTVRGERQLRMVGGLLPTAIRDRQILEWLDEVESERDASGNPSRVVRSILLRSAIPIAISSRARRLGRAFARPG